VTNERRPTGAASEAAGGPETRVAPGFDIAGFIHTVGGAILSGLLAVLLGGAVAVVLAAVVLGVLT
jgi:hypothetical protein